MDRVAAERLAALVVVVQGGCRSGGCFFVVPAASHRRACPAPAPDGQQREPVTPIQSTYGLVTSGTHRSHDPIRASNSTSRADSDSPVARANAASNGSPSPRRRGCARRRRARARRAGRARTPPTRRRRVLPRWAPGETSDRPSRIRTGARAVSASASWRRSSRRHCPSATVASPSLNHRGSGCPRGARSGCARPRGAAPPRGNRTGTASTARGRARWCPSPCAKPAIQEGVRRPSSECSPPRSPGSAVRDRRGRRAHDHLHPRGVEPPTRASAPPCRRRVRQQFGHGGRLGGGVPPHPRRASSRRAHIVCA
jgi:hypothetical protein